VLNELSLEQKLDVIKHAENKDTTQAALAQKFDVGTATISRIIKNKDKLVKEHAELLEAKREDPSKTFRFRQSSLEPLEKVLLEWFNALRARARPISGELLKVQALLIRDRLLATLRAQDHLDGPKSPTLSVTLRYFSG
jgi:transposase-like protein